MLRRWEGESVAGTAPGIGGGEDCRFFSPSFSPFPVNRTLIF
ncbi:L-arginine responsive protein LaoB [Escherichia coli]